MYVYMYTCIHVYMYICIYVYMYTCIYVYMHLCMFVKKKNTYILVRVAHGKLNGRDDRDRDVVSGLGFCLHVDLQHSC